MAKSMEQLVHPVVPELLEAEAGQAVDVESQPEPEPKPIPICGTY